ncbi:unnamed protein product, partial [marine sediment metagenome]
MAKKLINDKKPELYQVLSDVHAHHINIEAREVYIHGHYVELESEPGVDYRMATTFVKNLHFLEKINKRPIIIHMHTIGGEWNDGMAIYDAIKHVTCPTIMVAYAHARSMSSIIFQAADKRVMMPHADFMIHYGSISLDEISTAAKSSIDWNERANEEMLRVYIERCKDGSFFKDKFDKHIKDFLDKKM